MTKRSDITRRQFISASSVFGLTACFQDFISEGYQNPKVGLYKDTLKKVMSEQALLVGWRTTLQETENFNYAFEKIRPEGHQDLAFIVACSRPFYSMKYVIDEYARRKNGQKPLGPDHPVLDLKKWGRPNTYRILIFSEQMETLIREICQFSGPEWRSLWRNLNYSKTRHWVDFRHYLSVDYNRKLSDYEVKNIYDAICYLQGYYVSYTFCSTMVNRASELIKDS